MKVMYFYMVLFLSFGMVSELFGFECAVINCDCESIDAGLLTDAWKEQCREREGVIKEACSEGKMEQVYCDPIAKGKLAFPTEENQKDPLARERVQQITEQFPKMAMDEKIIYIKKMKNELDALDAYVPGLRFFEILTTSGARGIEAYYLLNDSLYTTAQLGITDPEVRNGVIKELVGSITSLDQPNPENATQLYDAGKSFERLINLGIGIKELMGQDGEALRSIDKANKWEKAAKSAQEMKQFTEASEKEFVDNLIKALPKEAVPALASPVGKFFRDLLDWNKKMWSSTTDALNLVTDAIKTGEMDEEAFTKVSNEVEHLGTTGPWTETTGKDFIKKTVEEIPGIGKLFKAFWD